MTQVSHPHALPRSRRLRVSSEFQAVRNTGNRLVKGCLILNWRPAASSRLGIVTSRKMGGAVQRSRARRVLRECFRRNQSSFTGAFDVVLVARRSINTLKMAEVERDFMAVAMRSGIVQH